MKINYVCIKNYRTLLDVKIDFYGYYSAISGKNNAGKTSIVKVLQDVFKDNTKRYFVFRSEEEIEYKRCKTQWIKDNPDIEFSYDTYVNKLSDPGLFIFIKKFYEGKIESDELILNITIRYPSKGELVCIAKVNNVKLKNFESNEILKKLRTSNLAFFHNSSENSLRYFIGGNGGFLHELVFSPEEEKQLASEQKRIQNKVKRFAREQKSELTTLLSNLEEKYDVEFTIPEGFYTRTLPFGINLKDRNVEVPLDEWGSGTQNRTQIMLSILQANKIKSKKDDENRITPIVLIEEPESFLHPSAQAEFGRVLRELANKLKIQTIVTTHSPYMLSQENPNSNILLDRKSFRNKLKETIVVDVKEDNWMQPFSEILGLDSNEFLDWKNVLNTKFDYVLLVEGDTDKKYLEYIDSLNVSGYKLHSGIEIVPYGGKDALKNTILLKFIIEKFKKVYITFDLDFKSEIEKSMNRIGLMEGKSYMAVGLDEPGKQCIEGLIPSEILSNVYSNNSDLVLKLTAQNSKDRNSAKSNLKKKILEQFTSKKSYSEKDLRNFKSLFNNINKAFS